LWFGGVCVSVLVSVNNTADDNRWWKNLFRIYARTGEYFEIHCWADETGELQTAQQFGEKACYGMPDLKIIHGTVSDKLISFLLNEAKPEDCDCYNKMVPFFTIVIGDHFSSEKYGTEMILKSRTQKEEKQIDQVLKSLDTKANIYRTPDNPNSWRSL
jgi:hypothetical protein